MLRVVSHSICVYVFIIAYVQIRIDCNYEIVVFRMKILIINMQNLIE